jgi:hypothetical protein
MFKMKILGYEMRPMHAVYAGLAALAIGAGGCSGSKSTEPEIVQNWGYEFVDKSTEQKYGAIKTEMERNGRLKHPGKWPAVLLRCASFDGDMSNQLTLIDLAWIVELETKRNNDVFDWPEGFPSEKGK